MHFDKYVSFLKNRMNNLPGEAAQMKMAPLGRKPLNDYKSMAAEYRDGSVLAHIFPIDNEPYLTFIRRIDDGKAHSGQIAFPGGKKDETDIDLFETAVREAFEEIGLLRKEINLIGSLSNLYIPVSRYMVQPFISFGLNQPDFKINKDEVQEVIPLRIKDLSNPEIISTKQIKTFEGIIRDVPCFVLNDITIWGATAMMVSEILDLGIVD